MVLLIAVYKCQGEWAKQSVTHQDPVLSQRAVIQFLLPTAGPFSWARCRLTLTACGISLACRAAVLQTPTINASCSLALSHTDNI